MREDILALGERIAEQCVHLDAAMHRLLLDLHEFDQAGGWHQQGFQSCAHWLSWRVGWDLSTARDRVRLANRLPELPKVTAKLASGELSYSKARAIARVATPEIEDALLIYAEHLPAAQLERVCGKLHFVQETRQAIQEARPRDRHERTVQIQPLDDGMACVKAVLTAEEAALLMNLIEEVARAQQQQTPAVPANAMVRPSRRLPRADALITIAQAYARGSSPERTPIDLLITVPIAALCAEQMPAGDSAESQGADDHSDAFAGSRCDEGTGDLAGSSGDEDGAGDSAESSSAAAQLRELAHESIDCLGELPSGAPLSSFAIRRLACDAGLVEVHLDSHGQPLSVGRKTRAIPAPIKRALNVRDRTCSFPGCSNRRFLEGHHIRHWADGGETSLPNLLHLCSRHHHFVHEQGYQIVIDDHGKPCFLDPAGRPVVASPLRPQPTNAGWPTIRAANESLSLDAKTGACKWAGEDVNYTYAIDVILGAERDARRQAERDRQAAEEHGSDEPRSHQ